MPPRSKFDQRLNAQSQGRSSRVVTVKTLSVSPRRSPEVVHGEPEMNPRDRGRGVRMFVAKFCPFPHMEPQPRRGETGKADLPEGDLIRGDDVLLPLLYTVFAQDPCRFVCRWACSSSAFVVWCR